MTKPSRGEIWTANLNPVRGHEQGGTRRCLVLSANDFNHGPAGLVVVLPITTRDRNVVTHVRVTPAMGGQTEVGFIKCEDVRSVSTERLVALKGTVDGKVMSEVEYRLGFLLGM